MLYKINRKELKNKKASDFKHNDRIECEKYLIIIKYHKVGFTYRTPSMLSYVMTKESYDTLDCTPGCGTPYYISDFINR